MVRIGEWYTDDETHWTFMAVYTGFSSPSTRPATQDEIRKAQAMSKDDEPRHSELPVGNWDDTDRPEDGPSQSIDVEEVPSEPKRNWATNNYYPDKMTVEEFIEIIDERSLKAFAANMNNHEDWRQKKYAEDWMDMFARWMDLDQYNEG